MAQLSDTSSVHDQFESLYVRAKPGRTLVAGSRIYEGRVDRRRRYKNAEGWDALPGEGVDLVVNLEHPLPLDVEPFDHIDCISVLEHSKKPWLLAANLVQLLNHGGSLYIAVPMIWRLHAYPNDYWRFTIEGIRALFPQILWHKMLYAHYSLQDVADGRKLPGIKVREYPYYARTEVLAFGSKQ